MYVITNMYCNLCNYLFILGDQSLKIACCKQRRRDKENMFLSFFNFTVNFYMYIIADVCYCYTAILYADNAMNTRWNWQEEAPICFLILSVIFPWQKNVIFLPVSGSFFEPAEKSVSFEHWLIQSGWCIQCIQFVYM